MYPRFGMAHVAIQTAQARARATQTPQRHEVAPPVHPAIFSDVADNDEAGVLWRMAAIIVVIAALSGAVAWFAA